MSGERKAFLFDLDLSRGDGPAGTMHAVSRVEYDAAVLRARAEGREQGFAEGMRSAEARAAERLAEEAERLTASVARLHALADQEFEKIRAEATALAFATARTLSQTLVERQPLGEIEGLVESCLGPLRGTPHLVVRLRAEDAELLRERIGTITDRTGFAGRLVILGEEDFGAGDCRVEWADGGLVRDMAQALAGIEEAVRRRFGSAIVAKSRVAGGQAEIEE